MLEKSHPLQEKAVLIAGVGNIGSHLGALLARANVGRILLVDRDHVEPKNLSAQDYQPQDVGRFKAEVMAERLSAHFPDTRFEAHSRDLEDLPVAIAAVDLILGALDSRRARQVLIGDLAWPLGVPAIDGGVGDGLLGRVQVFLPGSTTACLECTWGAADYRLATAEYPCLPGATAGTAPTAAPAFLGALVASLMVCEAIRVLTQPADHPAEESYEIALGLKTHHMRKFGLRRAPRCRHDHEIIREVLPAGRTAADLLTVLEHRFGPSAVRLEGRRAVGRFLDLEQLRQNPDAPLAELGLTPRDLLRARGPAGSVWLALSG